MAFEPCRAGQPADFGTRSRHRDEPARAGETRADGEFCVDAAMTVDSMRGLVVL